VSFYLSFHPRVVELDYQRRYKSALDHALNFFLASLPLGNGKGSSLRVGRFYALPFQRVQLLGLRHNQADLDPAPLA